MRSKILRLLLIAVQASASLSIVAIAVAAEPATRTRAFATLPDWTGIWQNEGAAAVLAGRRLTLPKLMGKPPYTVQAEKLYAPAIRALGAGDDLFKALAQAAPALKICSSSGFPGVMEAPVPDYLFELLVTPERVLLILTDGTVREIGVRCA